jgi:hypothetical protein
MDKHLADGSFFRHKCAQCGQVMSFLTPFAWRARSGRVLLLSASAHENKGEERWFDRPDVFCFAVQAEMLGVDPDIAFAASERVEKLTGEAACLEGVRDGRIWFSSKGKLYGILMSNPL